MNWNNYSLEFQTNYEKAFAVMRTEPATALAMMKELFLEAAKQNDMEVMADLYFGAGNVLFMLSDSRRSMDYLGEAVRYYKKMSQPEKVVRTQSYLGLLQLHRGEFTASIETFSEVMEIAEQAEDHTLLYKAYSQLAQCYAMIENWDKSIKYFDKAHRILQKDAEVYTKTESLPIFYAGYIESLVQQKDYKKAETLLKEKEEQMVRYPRFVGSPIDYWPQYCLEYSKGLRVDASLVQKMWNACMDERFKSAEYYIVMTAFLRNLYQQGLYEQAIELGQRLQKYLRKSDLSRRKMSISKVIIQSYQALRRLEEMSAEVSRYFADQENVDHYIHHSLLTYLHVRQENRVLLDEAYTDGLTGLNNRRALNEAVSDMYERAYHNGQMFGYEMLDIDLFKKINDQYGHEAGDRALQVIGEVLAGYNGNGVFTARYGGDEFTIIYQDQSVEQILETASKIRADIAQKVKEGECMPMTISQGIFCVVPHPYLKEWHYHANADRALYQSKISRTGAIHLNTESEEFTA